MKKPVIYGGWWDIDRLGRKVVKRTKCQAPKWDWYLENLRTRTRRGL